MANEQLMEEVMGHGGFADEERALGVVHAVLATLAERLSRAEAEALADELPAVWRAPLVGGHFVAPFEVGELSRRIAAREAVPLSVAFEHATVVGRAVGGALSDEARARLRRALSPDIFALFTPHEPSLPAEHPLAAHGHRLADARPGSRHPLSEAAPAAGQGDSVVCADNPHGDTKLSSARGLTQEREDDSLATGNPRSQRPVNERR